MNTQQCTHGGAPCPRIVEVIARSEEREQQRQPVDELTPEEVANELEQQYRWGYL